MHLSPLQLETLQWVRENGCPSTCALAGLAVVDEVIVMYVCCLVYVIFIPITSNSSGHVMEEYNSYRSTQTQIVHYVS